MAYFYNFNFNEDVMYCIPISKMYESWNHRRKIVINKEDDIIPRTTNPYICGKMYYMVHEFPETVYKRCFWMEERDDEKAEKIKNRYLEARAKKKENKCEYCSDDTKDIFFEWIPALFGKETENHDFNLDMTVYIDDSDDLVATVMFCDDILTKVKKHIKFCPFCGRRLRNE